ncbi:hypothetical protein HY448_02300 [Candidatus Pacearchaeota archaeon]|nr:hypothetical protein [Candidatus Pacearchaeota archaeon]
MNKDRKEKIMDAIECADYHFCFNLGSMLRWVFYEENHAGKMRPGLIDDLIRAINETTETKGPDGEKWIAWDESKVEPLINELRRSIGKQDIKMSR